MWRTVARITTLMIGSLTILGCLLEPEEPVAAALVGLQLRIDTSHGKTGVGVGSTTLTADGRIIVTGIGPTPKVCAISLTSADHQTLLDLAALVEWAELQSDYISPENPDGCCDQLGYTLSATLALAEGGKPSYTAFWFDEATKGGAYGLPPAFRQLVTTLFEMRYDYTVNGLCLETASSQVEQ
ncbi:MAG: hypothetical protein KC609_18145 [Myxococcales bacterium]|nr:hypothetical protein [Myxococcales bacterium]